MKYDPFFWWYNLLGCLALPPLGAVALGYLLRHPQRLKGTRERLGFVPRPDRVGRRPRIWLQAVSVGEVRVAGALIRALKHEWPEAAVVVSSTTPDGVRVAREKLGSEGAVIHYPLDVLPCVRNALRRIRPDIYISLETEIWPNLFYSARARGVWTVLANGRISNRSFGRYLRVRPFVKRVLDRVDLCCMITGVDAERIRALGMSPERILITGNAKNDLLREQMNPERVRCLRSRLGAGEETPVVVAGSIRGPEEPLIVRAVSELRSHPASPLWVVAPRHLRRVPHLVRGFSRQGISVERWSRLVGKSRNRRARVVILDTMGDLFDFYGVGDVVFCGGSLVPLGGQNVMEPAAWGRRPLYGPYMDDFEDAVSHLERLRGGIRVQDVGDLVRAIARLLSRPGERVRGDERAGRAFESFIGASARTARVIREMWLAGGGDRQGGRNGFSVI